MSQRPSLDLSMLAHFIGSEQFYLHPFVNDVLYTEGAKYVADSAQAYWLLDHIALAQLYEHQVKGEEFQVWDLIIDKDSSAKLICTDGNGREVYVHDIEWTNFPSPGIRLYFCNGCIQLPGEY